MSRDPQLVIFLISYTLAACEGKYLSPHPASDSIDGGTNPSAIGNGRKDTAGEYPFVALVQVMGGHCTGAALSCRQVLTAAHCLCSPSGYPGTADNTDCEHRVTVAFAKNSDSELVSFGGSAVVHSEYHQTYNLAKGVTESRADLAVITLDEPAPDWVGKMRLPDRAALLNERVSLVGFGQRSCSTGSDSTRSFGSNQVEDFGLGELAELFPSSVFVVKEEGERDDALALKGDSGGPLVSSDDITTFGVLSTADCEIPSWWKFVPPSWSEARIEGFSRYISVYDHRDWITSNLTDCGGVVSCADGLKNGAELDVDCGGSCAPCRRCSLLETCDNERDDDCDGDEDCIDSDCLGEIICGCGLIGNSCCEAGTMCGQGLTCERSSWLCNPTEDDSETETPPESPDDACVGQTCDREAGATCSTCRQNCCALAPALLRPVESQEFLEGEVPEFAWSTVDEPDRETHRVMIKVCKNSDMTNCTPCSGMEDAVCEFGRDENEVVPEFQSPLEPGVYYWQARAITVDDDDGQTGWGDWSEARSFIVVDPTSVCGGDECLLGEQRCSITASDSIERCGYFDADDCTEWGPPEGCAAGFECRDDDCFEVPCTGECMQGEQSCNGDDWMFCGVPSDSSCAQWVLNQTCPAGTRCRVGLGCIACGTPLQECCENRSCDPGLACDATDHCMFPSGGGGGAMATGGAGGVGGVPSSGGSGGIAGTGAAPSLCGVVDAPCCPSDSCDGELACVADVCATCDADEDDHDSPVCGGNDCDDSNGLAFPGATEECNEIDDDCDEVIDDGCGDCTPGAIEPCPEGDPDTDGVGICAVGTRTCNDGGSWAACNGMVPPGVESCTNVGVDNDCDGDELEAEEGVHTGDACTTEFPALCEAGTWTCTPTDELICEPLQDPTATEVCGNDLDDNCNGETDERCLHAVFSPTSIPASCSAWRWDTDAPDHAQWYAYTELDNTWSLLSPYPTGVVRLNAACFSGTGVPNGQPANGMESAWACGATACGAGTGSLLSSYGMPTFSLNGAPLVAPGSVVQGVIPAETCRRGVDPRYACSQANCSDCSCGFACCTEASGCEWNCRDNADNDGDGLTDCADPNCSHAVARAADPAKGLDTDSWGNPLCPW